jgi:antitoxin component YwqK of YwqJK toxin-antitoxin module
MFDKKDGPYTEYHYSDDQIRIRTAYVKGKIYGEYKEYHQNGYLYVDTQYVSGVLCGPFKCYYSNGYPELSINYIDGKRDGEWVKWYDLFPLEIYKSPEDRRKSILLYPTGPKREQAYYSNGKLIGWCKQWDRDGYLIRKAHFDMDSREGIMQLRRYTHQYSTHGTYRYQYYIKDELVSDNFPFQAIMAFLLLKDWLRRRIRHSLRQVYLDRWLIQDLGNIVLEYYF